MARIGVSTSPHAKAGRLAHRSLIAREFEELLKEGKQMNAKACAPSNAPKSWDSIDWKAATAYVKKLQMRIAKAQKEGRHGRVQSLQWLLTRSFYAKALTVKRVTENKGKRTSGVDKILWTTKKAKFEAIATLRRHGYQPQPLRRVYLRKPNGKLRPLGIPVITDRAMQTLYKFALEPVAETTGDPNSYGFRMGRCTQDAAVQCAAILARKDRAQWVLEGDIKGCFDNISHEWIERHISMDKEILHKFLKCRYIDTGRLFPTKAGTPQGGTISPTIANMLLDGLEPLLNKVFRPRYVNGVKINPKVNFIRYADDFIITGDSLELLETKVKPLVEKFMTERGLELSQEKTVITHITDGFDFLGFNIRRYNNGKFLIKPSVKNVRTFLDKVRTVIKHSKANTQQELIAKLNPIIRGWVLYHAHNASKQTFSAVDDQIWQSLWQWAKRRHTNKGGHWIYQKYFHHINHRHWTFAAPLHSPDSTDEFDYKLLERASNRKIQRFVKIESNANPFNSNRQLYFEERETDKMRDSLNGRNKLMKLFIRQKGLCPVCQKRMTIETGCKIHYFRCDNIRVRQMVHPKCHKSLHANDSETIEPAL